VIGSEFRAFRILDGMQRRRVSNWQYTQRNLSNAMNNDGEAC